MVRVCAGRKEKGREWEDACGGGNGGNCVCVVWWWLDGGLREWGRCGCVRVVCVCVGVG